MTTNIYDADTRKVASDSRWSIDGQRFIVWVDDSGFDKIVIAIGHAFVFAGDARLIQEWKDWIANPDRFDVPKPPVQFPDGDRAIALCIVDESGTKIVFEYGQDIVQDGLRLAGTGSIHALSCWKVNKDPCKAIATASQTDVFSGGEVKFFDAKNGSSNLNNFATLDEMHRDLLSRGTVMYKQSPSQTIPIKDAAKNDPEVRALVQGVESGAISASAPCDSMHNRWPQNKIEELHEALSKIFAKK